MKRLFKVRFHLGRGENYMKWRVENTNTKSVEFINPEIYDLILKDCKLYNQIGAANKIHNGGTKTVCAWIMTKEVHILIGGSGYDEINKNQIKYNPKVEPNWTDYKGNNLDKSEFNLLTTVGNKIFKI